MIEDTYEYSKTPQARYDKANTTYIGLRLEPDIDKDILDALKGKAEQTEVKRLARLGLRRLSKRK